MKLIIVEEVPYPNGVKHIPVKELVKCKDCKHAQEGSMGEVCCELLEGNDIFRSEEWFCADGESK